MGLADDMLKKVLLSKHGLWDFTPSERVAYYRFFCESHSLSPATIPFQWYDLPNQTEEGNLLDSKLTEIEVMRHRQLVFSATASCIDQLITRNHLSFEWTDSTENQSFAGVYSAHIRVSSLGGRDSEHLHAGPTQRIARARALRTVVLSFLAIGVEDESDLADIPGARRVVVDMETGVVVARQTDPPLLDELRDWVERDGIYTWDRFQSTIADITLNVIEGNTEGAMWDAYATLRNTGGVDGFIVPASAY